MLTRLSREVSDIGGHRLLFPLFGSIEFGDCVGTHFRDLVLETIAFVLSGVRLKLVNNRALTCYRRWCYNANTCKKILLADAPPRTDEGRLEGNCGGFDHQCLASCLTRAGRLLIKTLNGFTYIAPLV